MKNLTEKQQTIIADITNEFVKINETESSTDILSLIDNAINEKHILRKELEILDRHNRESIKIIKNEVMKTLQTICDKYKFSLECKEISNCEEYYIELTFNGYYNKQYRDSLLNARGIIRLPIEYKDGIRYVFLATPYFNGFGNTNKYSKDSFIQYFVDETIKVLKSNI
tara:strand:- start:24 stop:530 length:507 start_codon:yes stop_codon:yes gene_type:complete